MNTKRSKVSTETLTLGAVLTALVIILQFMGSFIKFGMFSISLVLIPIVIGASAGGWKLGAWLGFAFGMVVLLNGDAAAFLVINAIGTIITVLLKGTLCGLSAGITYKCLESKNKTLAVMCAAIVCPIVNTGIFFIGCLVFFLEPISEWAAAFGYGENVMKYMFLGLAGGNFLFELLTNIVLSPIVVRLLKIKKS